MTPEQAKRLTDALKKVDFLIYLSLDEMERLSRSVYPCMFQKGDVILHQGEMGNSFFLISRGRVSIWLEEKGKRRFIKYLGAGEYFGEMSLLTGEPRTATVLVEEPTEFFVVYKNDFKDILEKNPHIVDQISQTISQRKLQLSVEGSRTVPVRGSPAAEREDQDGLASKIRGFFGLSNPLVQ